MNTLIRETRLFLLALQFFTRVPVTGRLAAWVGYTPALMHASARHYPLVGAGVGAVAAAVLLGAAAVWPLPVAVGLSMAATVWMSGGFHEDGLADTCDGLGGTVGRERALLIMKDSRLGTYGALGLIGVLGLKATALHGLASVDVAQAALALVWAHALSRVVPVVTLKLLPYAGDAEHAKAKPMAQQVSAGGLAVALGWGVVACGAALSAGVTWATLAAALAGVALMTAFCVRWYRQRLGGYTGDTLGAAQQLTELAAYLGWLAASGSVHG
jgi:adenosylcobinamide-GDP ribazoletransferase